MLDIVSVGSQKVEYKDHSDIKFESVAFYTNLAEKTIAKFAPSNIAKEMLKSEDAVSSVANAIMMADWRWDENREGKTGQKKTHYSYRNQCAIWAIKSYISRKRNKKGKTVDHCFNNYGYDDELSLLDILSQDTDEQIDQIIKAEDKENLKDLINTIIDPSKGILTEKQCAYVKLYYIENMTFADIGKKFNLTREAVRQGLNKALEKLRMIINNV